MALVITKAVTEQFDPNVTDASGGLALLAAVQNADPEAARVIAPRPYTFSAEGTSLGNEAVTLALLAPVNLTALGVTFPANSSRLIKVRLWSKRVTQANSGYTEKVYMVQGGATPSLANESTLAGALGNGANDPKAITQTPNNNSAGAPEYAGGVVIMDAVATTNVIVGVQNFLGSTGAATVTPGIRWRLEVVVDPLVSQTIFS